MNPWTALFVIALSVAMIPGLPSHAQMLDPFLTLDEDDDLPDPVQLQGFDVLPLSHVARIAATRYEGKLIAARLAPPTPAEHARGVDLVHELRLLTAARDVLLIRLDARNGAFLEVAGAGLLKARRPKPPRAMENER